MEALDEDSEENWKKNVGSILSFLTVIYYWTEAYILRLVVTYLCEIC